MARRTIVRLAILAALAAGFAGSAHAQAFDCHQAHANAERLICRDKGLGQLDFALSEAYDAALDLGAQPGAALAAQRAWLAERNRCADVACLDKAYRTRLAALKATPRAAWTTFRDPRLKVSFSYLANRKLAACDGVPNCTVTTRLYGFLPGPEVQLEAYDQPLEQAARDGAGFELVKGRWMTTYGRFDPVPVERFSGPGWTGMKAVVTCGISDSNGFHAAAGECLWAVISNGKRSIVISTDGLSSQLDKAMRTVSSVRFEP